MTKSNRKALVPFFLHPIPLSAVALLAINDHYLKYEYPGFLTGKISDFAGLFYFPLFLAAIVCLLSRKQFNFWNFWPALIATDLVFIFLKTNVAVNAYLVQAFSSLFFPVAVVMDPTDLWALTMNVPTYLWARRYFNR